MIDGDPVGLAAPQKGADGSLDKRYPLFAQQLVDRLGELPSLRRRVSARGPRAGPGLTIRRLAPPAAPGRPP